MFFRFGPPKKVGSLGIGIGTGIGIGMIYSPIIHIKNNENFRLDIVVREHA